MANSRNGHLIELRTRRSWFLLGALIIMMLLGNSCRTYLADRNFRKAKAVLHELKNVQTGDVLLAQETIDDYLHAIRLVERARDVYPQRSEYRLVLSDLYYKLGVYSNVMRSFAVAVPRSLPDGEEVFRRSYAEACAASEIDLLNPAVHLARGREFLRAGNRELMKLSYNRAKMLYPVNAGIRYKISLDYLLNGMLVEASEEAVVLLKLDDSYRIGRTSWSEEQRQKRSSYYVSKVSTSYFYKALEILWRTSARNKVMVIDAVPDDNEARSAAQLFFEIKGVE